MPKPMETESALLAYFLGGKLQISEKDLNNCDSFEKQIDYIYKKAECDNYRGLPEKSSLHYIINTWKEHQKAMFNYQIKHYQGDITYISAQEPLSHLDSRLDSGWYPFIQGNLKIIRAEGNHHTMLKSHHVKMIANKIAKYSQRKSLTYLNAEETNVHSSKYNNSYYKQKILFTNSVNDNQTDNAETCATLLPSPTNNIK